MYRNINNVTKAYAYIRPYSTKATSDGLQYCANILSSSCLRHFLVLRSHVTDRQHDYENFLATLLMSKAIRSPAIVVRAFNVEVARIQDQTSDPQTSAFRLQFWLDSLKDIYKSNQKIQNIPANPVIQELFKVCCAYNLPRRHLEKLISSRNKLLKSKYFRSLDDVESYAEDTVSSIYYLLLSISGTQNLHADHVASHLGKAQGIANILRSIFVSNHHKMVSLPMDILMKHKISQETVLRCIDSEDIRSVAFEIATRANNHLKKARSIKVPKEINQLFLPAISVDAYLKNLEQCNFNLFDKSLQRRSATLPFNLYYKRLLNKY